MQTKDGMADPAPLDAYYELISGWAEQIIVPAITRALAKIQKPTKRARAEAKRLGIDLGVKAHRRQQRADRKRRAARKRKRGWA